MAKRINFFATKNDMLSILSKMEEQLAYDIKYIPCGKTDSISYEKIKDIPGLGTLSEKHSEIRGWYIGKEAESLYGKLRFICIGVSEPESYDFRITEQD